MNAFYSSSEVKQQHINSLSQDRHFVRRLPVRELGARVPLKNLTKVYTSNSFESSGEKKLAFTNGELS